jgi:hypothetical protein
MFQYGRERTTVPSESDRNSHTDSDDYSSLQTSQPRSAITTMAVLAGLGIAAIQFYLACPRIFKAVAKAAVMVIGPVVLLIGIIMSQPA